MQHSTREQIAALAGVFQAAGLVDRLAKTGQVSETALEPSIQSLFITSPETVSEVYGGYDKLTEGRQLLKGVLARDTKAIQGDIIRYSLALIHLEKKLKSKSEMLSTIAQQIEKTTTQVAHFGLLHENVLSSLGGLYLQTISTFKTRIQVTGEQTYLQIPANANKIRAILLAGIRSAMLWRQTGGSRWQLFFTRKKLLDALNQL
ncbi:high frequency lysogenization protein HflD [Candidatus Sororendozoicomonas aggregata]|uniref:high frequency lysogenization protein HflD n=1 Tax=Candidatus Sororendozoicomonas aggregata TaxID=3073239 RepID=UPI002ED487FB